MEMENRWSPRGVGGAGLGLGIAGTALGLMNGGNLGGILGGGYGCHENMPVNRYEMEKEQEIAKLRSEKSLLEANIFTDGKLNDLRNYMERRFGEVHAQLNQQAVYNATNTAALTCMQGQIAQLYSLTKLVVPNGSICPGWGEVTTTITPATAG
ncbi:MAG: hypothetical protein IKU47_05565 [Oscillospiraceae bacterium]|nr:hypothetical protein [Oscillospiraceae bacterium]